MQIICSDTNALVGGLPVPAGAFEFPLHGLLNVKSSGASNQVTVGMSDTLFVGPTMIQVESGPDVLMWFVFGLTVSMLGFGAVAFGRWIAHKCGVGPDRAEW